MKADFISFIKEQTEILAPKLSFERTLIHCALTDFIMSFIEETNKITPFKYRLVMEDDDERAGN